MMTAPAQGTSAGEPKPTLKDWKIERLGNLIKIKGGVAFSSEYFGDDGSILLTPGNFKLEGGLYFNQKNTKRYSGPIKKNHYLDPGALVVVMTDLTPNCQLLGKPAFVTHDEILLHNQRIGLVILTGKSVTLDYLYLHFLSEQHEKWMKESATGSTVRHTSNSKIYNGLVAIPGSLSEQQRITSALSDMDALIRGLDKLIIKKRDIQQAAMQQLLTGKSRLPGFSGEWEAKQLGEVFSISTGKSKSAHITNHGNYWIVDMGSVSTDGKLVVSKSTDFKADLLNNGDLVMPKDDIGGGGIIGRVGYIDANETYVLGDHVYRLQANYGNPLFLSFAINGYRINSELKKKVIGSAQLGLGRKSVEEQEISLPSIEEQTAIATILSDMDTELATLEARRDKARQIKQGMMQELLTGRIRLI